MFWPQTKKTGLICKLSAGHYAGLYIIASLNAATRLNNKGTGHCSFFFFFFGSFKDQNKNFGLIGDRRLQADKSWILWLYP